MISHITQSFIQEYEAYRRDEVCGNLIRKKYVDGVILDNATKAMKEGTYFEFLVSGALPKSGEIPMPMYKSTGKHTVSNMLMEYKRAHFNAKVIQDYLDRWGFKIIKAGQTIHHGRYAGTIDLMVECQKDWVSPSGIRFEKGEILIIDLKYSGLIDNRWEDQGWVWTEKQKAYRRTQSVHYHIITNKARFLYVVCQSNNSEVEDEVTGVKEFPTPVVKLFEIGFNDSLIENHIVRGNRAWDNFVSDVTFNSIVPHPEVKRCSDCILKDSCKDRVYAPYPEKIDL